MITCSALKKSYREQLQADVEDESIIVFLKGTYELLWERMTQRADHFMPASLLQSQLDTLEIPSDAVEVDIANSPEVIVNKLLELFTTLKNTQTGSK